MCMEPLSAVTQLVRFVTYQCYKATVNESETITNAKPVCGEPFPAAFPAGPQRS